MRDDFLTADWARHHEAIRDTITDLARTTRAGLARLHRLQFDAPWHRVR